MEFMSKEENILEKENYELLEATKETLHDFFFLDFFFKNHSEHLSSRVSENERKGNERKVMEHL